MVAQTRHGAQRKLDFHEKLVGKGLTTDALIKKLKALHTELSSLEQDLVDVNSLSNPRKELISTSILLHKDRGVKAYAACCLADILRLYAPDAPYTQAELRDIFQFFFKQLTSGLKGTDSSYYNEYFHLLESLSTVKSVILVCDLPNADELIAEIFRDLFALVRRDLSKKIEIFMADILVSIIDEATSLPMEVLEIIMAQFMDKNDRLDQPAFRLAVQVCNASAAKLQRQVCLYFTDIVVANSGEEDFEQIRTAHELVKRLHRSCPELLHSVIPQLEEELRVDNVTVRTIATQVLGEMFADKVGAELVKKYPTTWNYWLGRTNDKAVVVRLKVVEAMRLLFTNLPEMRDSIEEVLRAKMLDPDEKVRTAICKVYSQLDYEAALHHVSEKQLRMIADRMLDKKHQVRVEAVNCLAKLYSLAYPEIENNDPSAVKHFAWIPDEILLNAGTRQDIRMIVGKALTDYILPLPAISASAVGKGVEIDEVAWTDRLLNTMKYLSEKTLKILMSLTGLKSIRPNVYDHYVDACVKFNGGIIDENEELITRKLNAVIQHISALYPEPHKASEDLHAFAKQNENRLYKLLKTCMDPQTDVKMLVKSMSEFQKRLEQLSSSITPTLTTLLREGSYCVVNQSSIPTLMKRMQKGLGSKNHAQITMDHARRVLIFISKNAPALYKSHITEITKVIADEKNARLVEVGLQALANVVRWDEKLAPNDRRTNERIERLALQSNPRHAKFAARYLAFSKNKDQICTDVVESIAEDISNSSNDSVVAQIAVLAQFARFAPDAFEHKSDIIMTFLLKQVLLVPITTENMDDGEEWMEDDEVPDSLEAKILSLKVCRYRCLSHASSEKALEIATPVLKLLATLLEHSGTLSPSGTEDPKGMSRMRLQAAVSLLHLSTAELYANAISPKFIRLAVVIQDSCYNVRMLFLNKLISLLQPRKLPPKYNIIPFLTVHDPEAEVKNIASSYIQAALRKMPTAQKVEHFEIIFVRLLHLLAHHPDFNNNHEDLLDMAKYIQFYLDLVASQETVSLLYHLAMKLKTVQDSESQEYSENLYVISELAHDLIKTRAHSNGWTIQSYPGKVRLPSDILKPFPDAETARKTIKTIYLPQETRTWVADLSKNGNPKEKKERKIPAKRKAPPATKSKGTTKRARTAKKQYSNDEDEDEPSETEESEDEKTHRRRASEADGEGSPNEKLSRAERANARNKAKENASKKSDKPSSEG